MAGGSNTYGYALGNPIRFFDFLGLKVTGEWLVEPYVEQNSINIKYMGLEPTLGIDKYITVLLVRLNFNVSGNIIAAVKCTDECGTERIEDNSRKVSFNRNIDLGVNIPASVAGAITRSIVVSAILNAIVIDLKLNEGLYKFGKNLELKAAILKAYGADLICKKGWPKF